MHIIDTERLRIRQLQESDAEFYLGLLNEPSFHEHIGVKGVRSIEDAQQHLAQGPIKSYREHGYGLYLVLLKPEEAQVGSSLLRESIEVPIGICGVLKRPELPQPDIGFAFKPGYWGKAYAYESARALLDYEVQRHALSQVLAITSPQNTASQKLLMKLGFKLEGEQKLTPDAAEAVSLFRWQESS